MRNQEGMDGVLSDDVHTDCLVLLLTRVCMLKLGLGDPVFFHGVLCEFAERVTGCLVVRSVRIMGVIGCHVVLSACYLRLL